MPVEIVSNDGERFTLTDAQVNFVPFVKDIAEGGDGEVAVTGVKGSVLRRVVEFLTYRAEHPFTRPKKPLRDRSALTKNGLEEWYATFIEGLDMKDVFDLLRAGDFLRIEDLMDLAAARIARQYLQWSQWEKKSIFATGKDFTPDEEAALRAEHKWAEEDPELEADLREAARLAAAEVEGGRT